SLCGLFSDAQALESETVRDLAIQAKIHPKPGEHKGKTLELAPDLTIPVSKLPHASRARTSTLAKYGRRHAFFDHGGSGPKLLFGPPPSNPYRHLRDLPASRLTNVRVRVLYIPAPAVGPPPGWSMGNLVGLVLGGDNRGPQYSGGTSRLDVDVNLNRADGSY